MSENDETYFWGRLAHWTYYSRRISNIHGKDVSPRRFLHRIIEGKGGMVAVKEGKEVVLRNQEGARYQLKATLYENEHRVTNLTFQKWNNKGGPHKEIAFTLYGREIDEMLTFLKAAETMIFVDEQGGKVPDRAQVQSTFDRRQIAKILVEDPAMLNAVLEADVQAQDIFGLARRRRELDRFRRMLDDIDFRTAEAEAHGGTELAWQAFFERNTWIFGYGLSYLALSGLDGKALRNKVAGYNIAGRGKEVDGLMKTVAAVNSLCFVEIKTSETGLVRNYRPGVFAPSAELAGAVSQIQVTVQRALEDLTEEFRPTHIETGAPTGERLFQFQPRSFLVVGNLDEFQTPNGTNKDMFRSFELFRRSLKWPEVMTFDELYARARFIVDDEETPALQHEKQGED
ncbi:Shedu immune nuclease family protein [Rhizobium mongolense]|uniref:Shedu immune nuclease family protein n=1 Tax=Rhizobium mongolense TaxID=57676 RepID=UPI0035588C96